MAQTAVDQSRRRGLRECVRGLNPVGVFFATIWDLFLISPIYFTVTSDLVLWRKVLVVTLSLAIAPVFSVSAYTLNCENYSRNGGGSDVRKAWAAIAAVSLLVVLSALAAGSWAYLLSFSFAIGLALYTLPIRQALAIAGAAATLLGAAAYRSGSSDLAWTMLVLTIWVAIAVAGRMASQIERREHRLDQQLAVARERERIARDVHDLLGHSLTVINLKAQVLARMSMDPKLADEAAQIAQLAREGLTQVRQTVTELKSPTLAAQLSSSVAALRDGGLSVSVQGRVEDVPEFARPVAAWALREAATNILRHAEASRVWVTLSEGGVRVADDGRGLPGLAGAGAGTPSASLSPFPELSPPSPATLTSPADSDSASSGADSARDLMGLGGNGLLGLRARAAAVDGRLELLGRSGGGLVLAVSWSRESERKV